jgi:tyrosinase
MRGHEPRAARHPDLPPVLPLDSRYAAAVATGSPRAQDPVAPIRFRRNADRLTAGQLALLREGFAALYAIEDDRGYAFHAGIHGLPLPIGCDNAHHTPFFLPWHRAYLFFFERAMRDRVPDAMLTWWDWRTAGGESARVPQPFAPARISGKANPLNSARVPRLALEQGRRAGMTVPGRTRREPGDRALLPTPAEVRSVLELRDFLDFSSALEGLHDRVHVWTGGHMSLIPFAAFDPVFWAHHTMVDRLWRIWQLRHPGALPPRAIIDEALPPFRMTVRQTLDVTALGYDYAVASASSRTEARR